MNESAKNNNRFIAKLGFTLFVITAITALLLAGVNALTADPIAQLKIEARNNAMQLVMPDSTVLDDQTVVTENATVYTLQRSDRTFGYCVEVAPDGFGGPINMIVGIELVHENGSVIKRITGVSIVSMEETAGLGTKAKDESFISQFAGLTYSAILENGSVNTMPSNITVGRGDADIDAISGATVTSKAVTKGVNIAMDAIKVTTAGEGGAQ